MEHTLEPDQYVLVDKLTPRFDAYKRGDIVVFTPPADWVQDDGTPFIKRVIGLGGDTVEIHDGNVFINGTKIDEPYLYAEPGESTPSRPRVQGDEHRWVVPAGELFLMGDHRANSADSRTFGTVPDDAGHRSRLAALLAARRVRDPRRRRPTRSWPRHP